jgi:crossover junction endodeoxyribonuclease RuvC
MAQPGDVILGVDPSLRGTGYGVIEVLPRGRLRALAHGVVSNPREMSLGACLIAIHDTLSDVITTHAPTCAAIEQTIYVQSRLVAITLGCARGAAILAIARHGIGLAEYAPKAVKAAVAGRGTAGKTQVAIMVRALAGLDVTPAPDAADALAVAIAHANARASHRGAAGSRRRAITSPDTPRLGHPD